MKCPFANNSILYLKSWYGALKIPKTGSWWHSMCSSWDVHHHGKASKCWTVVLWLILLLRKDLNSQVHCGLLVSPLQNSILHLSTALHQSLAPNPTRGFSGNGVGFQHADSRSNLVRVSLSWNELRCWVPEQLSGEFRGLCTIKRVILLIAQWKCGFCKTSSSRLLVGSSLPNLVLVTAPSRKYSVSSCNFAPYQLCSPVLMQLNLTPSSLQSFPLMSNRIKSFWSDLRGNSSKIIRLV